MNKLPQYQILPATGNDLEAIQSLATRIWNDHYPGIITQQQIDYMLDQDYKPKKLQQDLDNHVCIDRLMIKEELVGFSAYGPTETPREIKLHKLYLDQSLHGQGFGSVLLEHCENQAKSMGYNKIILQVNKENHKAIKAYERNGYYQQQAVVVDIGKGYVMDDYIMAKSLQED
jgi:ribosomal protein S18 acetylase RimI-like enzyme